MNMSQSAAISGGVLCFSYSASSSQTATHNEHSFTSCTDGCVVRIPGPQILGYIMIMQLSKNDRTVKMPDALPDDFFILDSDYDAVVNGTEPSHTLQVPISGSRVRPKAIEKILLDQIDPVLNKLPFLMMSLAASTGLQTQMDNILSAVQRYAFDLYAAQL
ncbi:unnamed protein product [Somion occarium]|uniref:Uncharacterized protein n=1 Tax=Somion occarium TaxID=3059160 RepID=A0ABP1E1X1_9APHY